VTKRRVYFSIQKTQQQARSIYILKIAVLEYELHFFLLSFENSSCLPCNAIIYDEPLTSAILRTAMVVPKVRIFRKKSIKHGIHFGLYAEATSGLAVTYRH
jgi:hypothetical protein